MLVCKLELWPKGDQSKAKSLGHLEIANNLKGSLQRGSYFAKLFMAGKKKKLWHSVEVENFPRIQLSGWDLVFVILATLFKTRCDTYNVIGTKILNKNDKKR